MFDLVTFYKGIRRKKKKTERKKKYTRWSLVKRVHTTRRFEVCRSLCSRFRIVWSLIWWPVVSSNRFCNLSAVIVRSRRALNWMLWSSRAVVARILPEAGLLARLLVSRIRFQPFWMALLLNQAANRWSHICVYDYIRLKIKIRQKNKVPDHPCQGKKSNLSKKKTLQRS